ncbi:MAG TPA: hypothetical protein PKV98_04175 [Burkholderiaceae bacterium]|nr:hypothetical protein [Burkholderiaceae bacterium]
MSFPAKTPDEVKLVTFDFSSEAATGATLSNPTVEVTSVISGSGVVGDITAASVTVASQTVTALIGGGVSGTKYRLTCVVDASNGETHRIDKDLPVKESAAVVQ